ncbi:MAG TPA: heme-binding beta-barrel domain-containing protein [Acidimicrobiales bacterium]
MSWTGVEPYGNDLYTEADGDPDTLANLGPLAAMAGVWEGTSGADAHPAADGTERNTFVEHYELQPIDRQTNGPQLFYGLRYHTHIVKPGEVETFHDQVGYWLWEPATATVTYALAIPRGQVLLAGGSAEPDATEFEVRAAVGSEVYGILSNPYLDQAFRTLSYRMSVTVHPDGTWSYEEEGVLDIPDRDEPFSHIDRNTLTRIGPPTPNPLAGTPAGRGDLGVGSLWNESRPIP